MFWPSFDISYKDHVTNKEVCGKIQQAIGPHEDLTIVKGHKLQWYGRVSCSSSLAKTILQGTGKGEEDKADRGRDGKTTSGSRQAWRAVENWENWRKLVAKSSVVPQRLSQLRDRWWDDAWIWTKGFRRYLPIVKNWSWVFFFKFSQGTCPWMAFAWIFSGFFSFLRWGLWDESVIGNIQCFGAQIFLAVWPHWSITHSCSSRTHCVEHWPCWDVRQVSFSDTALSRCLGVLFPALSPDRSQAYPTATSLGCVCVMIFKRKCFTLLKDFLWRSPPCTGRCKGNNFDFFCSWVRGGADSCVPWALLSCKTTGLIFFLLSLIRTHSSRWLFCRYGACGICLCFHNPPNSYMDYRIVNVRMWSFLTRTRDLGLWSHRKDCKQD